MMFDFRLLIWGLLLLAGLDRVAHGDTLLRWKFAKGEQLQVTVDQHTVTEATGAGKPAGIDITMQMRMLWTVDSVDASGTARITQRFERFAVTMKSGTAEPIEYASDSVAKPSGAAADIAAAISPVIGADFTVTMTERGAIADVKLSDAASAAFDAIDSPALKQIFSAEGISQLLRQTAVEFPEQAVMPQGNWSVALTTPSPLGMLKQNRTYTLTTQEAAGGNTVERMEITGQLVIEPNEQAPSKLKLVDQELVGSMTFDASAGRLVSSQSKQRLTTERPYREFKIKVETTAETTSTISSR